MMPATALAAHTRLANNMNPAAKGKSAPYMVRDTSQRQQHDQEQDRQLQPRNQFNNACERTPSLTPIRVRGSRRQNITAVDAGDNLRQETEGASPRRDLAVDAGALQQQSTRAHQKEKQRKRKTSMTKKPVASDVQIKPKQRRKSAAPKRKTREPSPPEDDDVLYAIRDIIDEKFENGKLYYRVDWADDPITGESFDPTWEPAENVTDTAIADWEAEKRRRQGLLTETSQPSNEIDSQPVLAPNWRAKRRRGSAVSGSEDSDDEKRRPKKPRNSVDSGYTSTDSDNSPSWAYASSSQVSRVRKVSNIVLEIKPRLDFDPSEYQVITSSQLDPESQTEPATSQANGITSTTSGNDSQRTIPDSQGYLDSLRSHWTTPSATQSAIIPEAQTSRSDLGIPSRQPEEPGLEFGHFGPSFGLLPDQPAAAQETSFGSLEFQAPQHYLGGQSFLESGQSSGGFLTQPIYHLHESQHSQAESQHTADLLTASAVQSGTESQLAQEVSPLDSISGFLTQVVEPVAHSSQDIVPETVFKVNNYEMDQSSEETPRKSAVDMMRELHEEIFGSSSATNEPVHHEPPTIVAPSALLPSAGGSIAEHLEASAAPEHPPLVLTSHAEGVHAGDPIASHEGMDYEVPTTVAPADLTTSVDPISTADDQILGADEAGPVVAEPEQRPLDEATEDRRITVTLPMAANTRHTYLETIKENKSTLMKFGGVFATSCSSVPEPSLVAKLDSVFERLMNLCDLPAYDADLPELDKEEMMKHATNSNSKFLFVHELLGGLWDMNIRILIVSQPGRVFDYLEAVVSRADCHYHILTEDSPPQPAEGTSVILATAGQDLSKVGSVDAVVAFDRAARSVELPATLRYPSAALIVLSLVATYSLDHIDHQLAEQEPNLDDLERRNALNLATATAIECLRNPERRHHIEPHHAAKMFANFLRNMDGPDGVLEWEPYPLPDDIFEIWLNSQNSQERQQASQALDQGTQTEREIALATRKRPLDTMDEGIPKRPRMLESQQPSRNATPARMSDLLKRTLEKHGVEARTTASQVVEVPVEHLERLSDKIADLEARLATSTAIETKTREHCVTLESQLRSFEKTVRTLQPKYMEALKDRGTFEKQCQQALQRLEAQTAEVEPLKQKIKDLENKLAETNNLLANSSNPDVAKLATLDKLEKKVQGLQNELDYTRKAYQDASNAHTELQNENKALQARVTELERRASENLLRIHQIHANTEAAEANRRIDELHAILENRERELDRAKEELRFVKNTRRETRQGSVPRSPRTTAMMSPRPSRAIGSAGAAGPSRGTSPAPLLSSDGPGYGSGGGGNGSAPVPGMTYFSPTAGTGGRWGHLRD
ncbi:hypothetical protein VTJ49DRAFT_175 [Mycothermus thermophilus]|uniref:Chromo domain-containing protein n=1 Tax=Humicola insolens TaxID=85995 RepID=A0ABR3VFV5_HUMIN